ncbi:MAG: hypothetical protein K2M08_02305 [Anaeroplasmataceae bacterium]|nr:hypothetical protein [Anaeroplasmataceae bacterium]
MKIDELKIESKKCETFLDWIKLEKKLKVSDFFLTNFQRLRGVMKVKKNKIRFSFSYRNNYFLFLITNSYMDFKIDNIKIYHLNFLFDYKYKEISTRDIYKYIDTIACSVEIAFNANQLDFEEKLTKALSFGEKLDTMQCLSIDDLHKILNYGNVHLDFLSFKFNGETHFYRIRANAQHADIKRTKDCLAPPFELVTKQERFNQKKESILYGSLFSPNPCFQETNLKLGEKYIFLKGTLIEDLKLTGFINPGLDYFIENKEQDFIVNLLNIFKMSKVEKITQISVDEQNNIYDLTNYLKTYACKYVKQDGFLYYSSKTQVNYNVALNNNRKIKIKEIYECFTLNDFDEYNQCINSVYEAKINNDNITWLKRIKPQLDYCSNFPTSDMGDNSKYYLNKQLREIEILNGDPIGYDVNGRSLKKK